MKFAFFVSLNYLAATLSQLHMIIAEHRDEVPWRADGLAGYDEAGIDDEPVLLDVVDRCCLKDHRGSIRIQDPDQSEEIHLRQSA